jgi:hypothetical protein
MTLSRAVISGILLFLGHELNFLFAGAMAGLIGFRLTPLLPPHWPNWYDYVLIFGLAIIAAAIPFINPRFGYVLSGFLAGGYFMVEYYEPGLLTLPLLPFLLGAVLGSVIMGVFTEWALIVVSCLFGAFYVTQSFALSPNAEILVGSGLFIIGALTQVLIRRMQKED